MSDWSVPNLDGRTVAILGAGVLGRRMALMWTAGGYDVKIRDPNAEQRAAAIQYVEENVASRARTIGKAPGTVTASDDLAATVKDAWTVIEAVPEVLQMKIDTFGELVKLTKPDCLLGSNSSSYRSSEMLEKVTDADRIRILNTHYMLPPAMNVVELMTCGATDPSIFPFYVERLRGIGMSPYVARKESTGFIFNRLWAAIKRETLTILSEGVSVPSEIDKLWLEMYSGGKSGPCAMMDNIGLDTIAFIEDHYVHERGLSTVPTIDYLKKNFLDEGKLGVKSNKGGLYTKEEYPNPDAPAKSPSTDPDVYFLDLGVTKSSNPTKNGRILKLSSGSSEPTVIVDKLTAPDGLDISQKTDRIYWTNMGFPFAENNGTVMSCKLDGSDMSTVIPSGTICTPKQLTIDQSAHKIYLSDREGLRVLRCNLDGSDLETLIQNGDFNIRSERDDVSRWCVGIAISAAEGKFYWTQKGPAKGGKGRILRADIQMPAGKTALTREDVEAVLDKLPEPIDLEIEEETSTLYWTDRGEIPRGNTVNSIELNALRAKSAGQANPEFTTLARNMHEAIGIKLDSKNKQLFATDLGGSLYRIDLASQTKTKVYDDDANFTGVTLSYV